MTKCKTAGMRATWVMTEEEKAEKKEAAIAKKKLKIMSAASGASFDRAQVPVSSYLKKRAEIKANSRSKSRSCSGGGNSNDGYAMSRGKLIVYMGQVACLFMA